MAAPALHLSYKSLINGNGTMKWQHHRRQPLPKHLNRCTPLMRVTKKYEEEVEKLVKAIDIATEAYEKFKPSEYTDGQMTLVTMGLNQFKQLALNPEPQYKKLASLKCLISDFLIPFQEGVGKHVEYFWNKVAEERLGYKRENKMEKILARGKIKDRIEYDYVIDSWILAQQSNLINEQQAALLSDMVSIFENRKRRTT